MGLHQLHETTEKSAPAAPYHRAVLQHVSTVGADVSIQRTKEHRQVVEAFGEASDMAVSTAMSPYGLPWVVRFRDEEGFADISADITDIGPVVAVRIHGERSRATRLYFHALKAVFDLKLRQDGNPVIAAPLTCRGVQGVDELVRTILSPKRTLPVIIISLAEQAYSTETASISPQLIAGACRGLAHVYVLTGPDTYLLTARLGKQWSVFRGAIRVYWPGCNVQTQSPLDHPLATSPAIERWKGGAGGYVSSLIALIHSASLKFAPQTNLLPPTFDDLKDPIHRIDKPRSKPKPSPTKATTKLQRRLADLPDWAGQFSDTLVLTPRSLRALKTSTFGEPDLAFSAIELLATSYARMRREGGSKNIRTFEDGLRTLQLRNERTGDQTLITNNPEYNVDHHGVRYLLDWHLKRPGNTRDPLRCFRLYFHYCQVTEKVIVGSLPGHLTTGAT